MNEENVRRLPVMDREQISKLPLLVSISNKQKLESSWASEVKKDQVAHLHIDVGNTDCSVRVVLILV